MRARYLVGVIGLLLLCFILPSLHAVSNQSFIAYYSFDNGGANNSVSGNDNGTIFNTTNVSGIIGSARNFTQPGNTVNISFANNTDFLSQAFSTGGWIKSSANVGMLWGTEKPSGGQNPGWYLGYGSGGCVAGNLSFWSGNSTAGAWACENTLKVNNGTFVFIGVSYYGDRTVFYVNGNKAANVTSGNSRISQVTGPEIGWNPSDNSGMNGTIDEVFFVNRTLNDSEWVDLWNNSAGLAWPFLNATSQVPVLTLEVNDTNSSSLVNSFCVNITSTNGTTPNQVLCNATGNTLTTNVTFVNGNITWFNISSNAYFNRTTSNYNFNSTSTLIAQSYQSNVTFRVLNFSNGALVSGFCVDLTNGSTNTVCTSGTTITFSTVNGTFDYFVYNISGNTFFNISNTTGYFNSVVDRNNTVFQAFLNVSAYRLFLNTSIGSFNVTNINTKNTSPVSNYATIPASVGSNNIQVAVTGNYSQNYTCTVGSVLSTVLCNATSIYDNLFTVGATNSTAAVANFTVLISNATLGGLLYSVDSTPNVSVVVPLLQGYYYQFNVTKTSYVQNSSVQQATAATNLWNATILPITVYVNFFDEVTRNALNGVNVSFSVIDGNNNQTAYSTNTSTLTLSGQFPPGNYTFRYGATGYSSRDYYFTVGYDIYNLSLYLINQSTYTPGIIEVHNADGSLAQGVVVILSRYYNTPNVPNIVQMGTTSTTGTVTFTAQAVTGYYFFNVSKNGVTQYNTITPELLPIYSDGLWHRIISFGSVIPGNQSQNTGFVIGWLSPNGTLQNGSTYNFSVSVNSSIWSVTSCVLYLVNRDANVVLASNNTFCSSSGGIGSIQYTTGQANMGITSYVNVSTLYFTNQYVNGYSVLVLSNESYTAQTLVNDIGNFSGGGFDSFSRFMLSVVIMLGVMLSVAQTTTLVNDIESAFWLLFVMSCFFSYAGWLTLNFVGDSGGQLVVNGVSATTVNAALQQWWISILLGFLAVLMMFRRWGVFS